MWGRHYMLLLPFYSITRHLHAHSFYFHVAFHLAITKYLYQNIISGKHLGAAEFFLSMQLHIFLTDVDNVDNIIDLKTKRISNILNVSLLHPDVM
jgi:hypothetical protein